MYVNVRGLRASVALFGVVGPDQVTLGVTCAEISTRVNASLNATKRSIPDASTTTYCVWMGYKDTKIFNRLNGQKREHTTHDTKLFLQ